MRRGGRGGGRARRLYTPRVIGKGRGDGGFVARCGCGRTLVERGREVAEFTINRAGVRVCASCSGAAA